MSATTQSQSHPVNPETRHAILVDPAGESPTGWSTQPETRRTRVSLVGEMLGSYRVLELVGSGGMGCVYRAEHARLGRTVALKVLHEHHARRRDAALRLFQEARASSQIRHRNIVDVVDYLELDGDLVCIVMEYLHGSSLAELMDTPGALPAARALDLLAQIADGLDAAHGAGIVHRDLKPDNVVVVPDPGGGGNLVKLLDFGVAKLAAGGDRGDGSDGVDGPLTAAGQVVGTPPYMSPEQASGAGVDARTDVYALGAIMYEIFTGQTPFVARTFDEYIFKHLTVAPAPPRTTPGGSELDPRIESVIMRCLEKEPDARFGSARELGSELIAIRDGLTLAPPPPPDEVASVPAFAWHGASAARAPIRRSVWAGLAVAAAALVGFALARDAVTRPAAPAPTAAARAPGPASPPEGPALVRVVSEPPARVYPAGRDQAMCRTPCAIAIASAGAPRIGRAARPTYTVRRRGYRDEAFSVDPDAPPSQVRVRLEREHRAPDKPTRARIGGDATLNPYSDLAAPSDRP